MDVAECVTLGGELRNVNGLDKKVVDKNPRFTSLKQTSWLSGDQMSYNI